MTAARRKGLGRGLSALLGDADFTPGAALSAQAAGQVRILPIETVAPNPDQPRKTFNEAALEELAASIREKGVLQPILVRPNPREHGAYEIIAGERRWRASQRARLHEIPAIIKDLDDAATLEVAIIENIQRSDLNPVEEAAGFAQLIESFSYTQEQLAQVLGKSRSHVANTLRLMKLPDSVRAMLAEGQLSAGHARALIGRDDAEALAEQIIAKGLNVREVEALLKSREGRAAPRKPDIASAPRGEKDADTAALEADLAAALGAPVSIDHRGEGGVIAISYKSLSMLDDICERLRLG